VAWTSLFVMAAAVIENASRDRWNGFAIAGRRPRLKRADRGKVPISH
jgi:hypothetical protein